MRRDQVLVGEPAPPPQPRTLQSFLQHAKEGVEAVVDKARDISNSHHAAPLWGEWRRGLKDLQDVFLQPLPDSMKIHEEPGTIGCPTSQEVFLNKTGRELEIDMGR